MLDNIISLFMSLFNSCVQFDFIIYLLSASALLAVISSAFKYLLKGKY